MVNLGDLNFSQPIMLSCEQTMSVVVDGLGKKGSPTIGNYGLIYQGSENTQKIEKMKPEEIAQLGPLPEEAETEEEELLKEGYHTVNRNNDYFLLKACFKELTQERNFEEAFSDQIELDENDKTVPKNANNVLNQKCASSLNQIFSFTVKTFPNFGAYGYVNYNLGEDSNIQSGVTLTTARGNFDAYK